MTVRGLTTGMNVKKGVVTLKIDCVPDGFLQGFELEMIPATAREIARQLIFQADGLPKTANETAGSPKPSPDGQTK